MLEIHYISKYYLIALRIDERPPRLYMHRGIEYGKRPLVGAKTADSEIDRAGLRIMTTLGRGESFFHCVRNHFVEFNRETQADDIEEMRRRTVDYLLFDARGINFCAAVALDIDISMLRRNNPGNKKTWPVMECFYAISNLYNLKVTVFKNFFANKRWYHEVHEYWPHQTEGPDYPPTPSADWMCVKYSAGHFELLLPKSAGKRKLLTHSFSTPVKSSRPSKVTTPPCQCVGPCGTRSCICFKEGRVCTAECHPLSIGICENVSCSFASG